MDKGVELLDTLRNSIEIELTNTAPQLPYMRRTEKNAVHWGQRKLLLSEIQFLTQYGDLSDLVVYAGSAPGVHTPYLSSLFPTHTFVLVDPNPFKIAPTQHIHILSGYFDDQLATTLNSRNPLFISDIRTAEPSKMTPRQTEMSIIEDNLMQVRWVEIMNPIASMLKFRCAYVDSQLVPPMPNTVMYEGKVMLQAWSTQSGTETRLIVRKPLHLKEYNNRLYQDQMFYHNVEIREKKQYPQPIKSGMLKHDFDSSLEVVILGDFLRKFPKFRKSTSILTDIQHMSEVITQTVQKGYDQPFQSTQVGNPHTQLHADRKLIKRPIAKELELLLTKI